MALITAKGGAITLALCLSAGIAQSLNPTGSIGGTHDPVMIREGNTYYLYHTGGRVPTKTSPNMIAWTSAGSALSSVPSWIASTVPNNRGGDMWAPDISHRNGNFWLYYSVSSFGSNSSAIGLATRTTLASGEWQDQGMVITSTTFPVSDNAIDPNIIVDTEGKVWMCWGSFWNGIHIVQLNPETGKPVAGAQATHIAGRGGKGIEGPFIIHARGYYHLFTSWDKCCAGASSTYNMRYGRSLKAEGPYVDKAGVALTAGGGTLLSDGSQYPGGHNSVLEDNGKFFLIYHIYTPGINLQIRNLFFDSQGWPTLDASASGIETISPLPRSSASVGEFSPLHDPLGRRFSGPMDAGKKQAFGSILLDASGIAH
ncbi:MAG: arabinan endo-1,5-alpha-L-arabinosidase [Fibrobacteria bacterium]